jgi:hypothetical protein
MAGVYNIDYVCTNLRTSFRPALLLLVETTLTAPLPDRPKFVPEASASVFGWNGEYAMELWL